MLFTLILYQFTLNIANLPQKFYNHNQNKLNFPGGVDFSLTMWTLTRLLYKYEYDNIFLIIRDPKKQTDKLKNKIQKERKAQSNQRRSLHFGRKIFNILKTLKDSLMEIVNLMLTQTKKTGPVGDIITTQDAYVNKIKAELAGTVNNSFEPLLEKYIYRKVLVEVLKNNDVFNITGILTKYTANFIRINNMTYKDNENIDIVLNRKYAIVRSLVN
jgi:hypothetical protein